VNLLRSARTKIAEIPATQRRHAAVARTPRLRPQPIADRN